MKFSIIDNNKFSIYVNNKYLEFKNDNENGLYNSLKKILINIRKKYGINIYGFFDVDIYEINKIGTILKFEKKDEDDFINKTVDLKIINHDNNNIYLKFSDYYLISKYKNIKILNRNYYLNANDVKEEDINKLIEFCDIKIGLC